MSMKPGLSTKPVASMALSGPLPPGSEERAEAISAMSPPRTTTSAGRRGAPVPSTKVALLISTVTGGLEERSNEVDDGLVAVYAGQDWNQCPFVHGGARVGQAQPDHVANVDGAGPGVEPQIAVLVVDSGDGGAVQRRHRGAKHGADGLRLGQAFVHRKVALARVQNGQPGLGLGNHAGPADHSGEEGVRAVPGEGRDLPVE